MISNTKWNKFGPCGLKCKCCRIGSKSEAKTGVARTERRRAKIALKQEMV